jgi:predicted lipid-binding transport protein (Tim44 family)
MPLIGRAPAAADGPPLQALELLFLAALAAVVLYQLYSVLGRRVGRQPEDAAAVEARRPTAELEPRRDEEAQYPEAASGLASLRQRAYEMIVLAFSNGDRDTLKNLLTPAVYETFESAITRREADGGSEKTEFLQAPRADLEDVLLVGDTAQVKVRFLAEFRTRSKGSEGEAVDDRRTAELWTFERDVTSRDPNWALAKVEPAEV